MESSKFEVETDQIDGTHVTRGGLQIAKTQVIAVDLILWKNTLQACSAHTMWKLEKSWAVR